MAQRPLSENGKSTVISFRVDAETYELLQSVVLQARRQGSDASPNIVARALVVSGLNVPVKKAVALEILLSTQVAQKELAIRLDALIKRALPDLLAGALSSLRGRKATPEPEFEDFEPEQVA